MDRRTVWLYKATDDEFAQLEAEAEMEANELVEDALFRSALGGALTGRTFKNGEVASESFAAPNVTAQQVWLYNRNPERWRDQRNLIVAGNVAVHPEDEGEKARREAVELEKAAQIDPDAIRYFARAAASLGQATDESAPESAYG